MKIYIATFFNSHNYGAFLQAFSLQKEVKESYFVNFIITKRFLMDLAVGCRLKKVFPFFWKFFALWRLRKFKQSFFSELQLLSTTKSCYCSEDASAIISDAESLITGSDQVWNPNFINKMENLFFLNGGKVKCLRISYAASLGMKEWPKPFEQKVLPMLKRFDAISVREESAVSYLTSLGLKNVVCVCDPTLLHKGDFYRKEFPYKNVEEDFSFVYRIREVIPDVVQNILLPQNREIWLSKPRRWRLPSVTQWLQNIDNAKFVVTDSFHCAVFSILFHKPFLVIPNRSTGKGMNERFATLLGKTGLEYRCLTCEESSEEVLQKLNTPIDWEHVDAILEEWRTYSANWLEKALGA